MSDKFLPDPFFDSVREPVRHKRAMARAIAQRIVAEHAQRQSERLWAPQQRASAPYMTKVMMPHETRSSDETIADLRERVCELESALIQRMIATGEGTE